MVRILCRFVYVLVLALFVAQASGMVKLVAEAPCAASCPGDDDHGTCPPDCAACTCCMHVRFIAAPVVLALFVPESESLPVIDRVDVPPVAEPRGIQHVPKLSRA